jgi:UDP-N-acetylglucosamine--N-acetylmuramyl-(pentapeptide) pyrophosphoryl-undecaprenol N-acetylglucosamine transferase
LWCFYMDLNVVIVPGGTGGHLFPGIAVAQEFQSRLRAKVTFLTTPKPVTVQILERYQLTWEGIASRPLKGEGLFSRLRTVFGLPGYIFEARARLKAIKPHLVLGMGGHAAGPVGVAAYSLGIPLAIHEQNTIPGATNRWLACFARRVFLSFPDPGGRFPAEKSLWTGNPIRGEFFKLLGTRADSPFTVMFMGGSQGAHHLNMETLAALPRLSEVKDKLRFLHLTGESDYDEVLSGYQSAKVAADVAAFTADMAQWMARAHLLVCRAGASSLAELAAVGRAAILVPYPFAANNHQEHNARFFEASGAAEVILNKDFTGELLADKIRQLMAEPETLNRMEAASHTLAKPHAAREIVEGCFELLP